MNGAESILKTLENFSVSHVFGLVGETSFPLYESWESYPNIKHISGRDERNVAIMADGFSRAGTKPGVCEVPGVGASYAIPGIIEAYRSGVPLIVLSSDVSTDSIKKNYLTEYDKSLLFSGITKEFININTGKDIPRLLRRAFRVATTGKMGPVFVNFPVNVYSEEVDPAELYGQREFSVYPSLRPSPDDGSLKEVLKLINKSSFPLIVCGQGVILSHAEQEVYQLAKILQVPVGTTMSGKGAFPEDDPLSIGVIGSRGGTDFSNAVADKADLVFFIGTNTDSASTYRWKYPPLRKKERVVIHLDISEAELGNNYPTDVFLYGDAKATLSRMIKMALKEGGKRERPNLSKERLKLDKNIDELSKLDTKFVNPLLLVKNLENLVPEDSVIVSDPGTGAIYLSAYFKAKKPKRKFIFNYSIGALGFSLPASIGAFYATGKKVVCLTTDGNFAFFEGELETVKRYNMDIKIIIINNGSFGWIRAAMLADNGKILAGTEFYDVDYSKIAAGYGLKFDRVEKNSEVLEKLTNSLTQDGPTLTEVFTLSEDRLLPPVPEWKTIAEKFAIRYMG
ncbi:MAG: thiamine pyrophosphate-binding protein [Thermoplasmatales archaeon]